MKMEKEFNVKRMKNGYGHSNLIAIITEAVPDMSIGSSVIVPYANGYKDPTKAVLQVDESGAPVRCNEKFAIVSKYIYE